MDPLPLELILSIADWLLTPDIICLSLCNKQFYQLLLRKMQRVTPTDTQKLEFLARYERDHPEYFVCDICKTLHRYDGSESFGLAIGTTTNQPSCPLPCVQSGKWCSGKNAMEDHIWAYHAPIFSFLHLKLAMKRFRHGQKYGISLRSLLHKQVEAANEGVFFFSRDAEICSKSSSLYVRRQNIIITRPSTCDPDILPRGRLIPCFGGDLYALVLGVFVECRRFEGVSFPYTCDICNTDIEVEVRRFSSGKKIAIIITRWTNLGPGLTQEDELWKAHIKLSGGRKRNHARLAHRFLGGSEHGDQPPLKHGKVLQVHRATFEDITGLSYEELKFINLSYLRDDNYKFTMEEVAKNMWTIPFKESKSRLGKLWHSYFHHRSFHSSWRILQESKLADKISPTIKMTTYASRELLFDLVYNPFEPLDPYRYPDWPPPPPTYGMAL